MKDMQSERMFFEQLFKRMNEIISFHSILFSNFVEYCNAFQSNPAFEIYEKIYQIIDLYRQNKVIFIK